MKGKRASYLYTCVAAIGLMAAGSGQGLARTTAEPAADQTSEDAAQIVVTARRVEERLQDVPISMTVFNQQQLSNRNVVTAQDLAIYTPSLQANTNFGSDNSTFALRGFVQDIGTPPSVGVYFADVVAPRAVASGILAGDGAGPGSFFDLQNVQVLKGPQGTLFGRNTTGGAILLVPQKPLDRFGGYVEGSLGNYDLRRLQGAINLPLGASARLRVAGDYQTRDGFLKNNTGIGARDFGDINYVALRASLIVDVTPDLENYTVVSYTDSDTNGFVQKLIGCDPGSLFGAGFACPQLARQRGTDFYTVQANMRDPRSHFTQWQAVNTSTWQASDTLTIKNIASYAQLKQNLRTPLFGVDWTAGGQPFGFAFIQPPPGLNTADQWTFTEELQLQGKSADERFVYQGGFYFEKSGPLALSGSQTPILIACTDVETFQCTDFVGQGLSQQFGFPLHIGAVNYVTQRVNFRDVGLYAQASMKILDQLKLTAGFRYTWDRQGATTTRIGYSFPVVPPLNAPPTANCSDAENPPKCTTNLSTSSSAPTWLVDLDYTPSDDVLIYAKYARGYRAGGIAANSPSNYRLFRPEKVDAYEVGVKTTLRGAISGTLNVAGFYNDFTNQQLQVGFTPLPGKTVPQTSGVVNAGRSRIYGGEVEFNLTPFEGLRLDGGYTYLNAKIRAIAPLVSLDPNYFILAQILPGDPLILSPKHKLTVSANYTLPMGGDIGSVTLGGTVNYVSSQLTNYAYNNLALQTAFGGNLAVLPARTLLNLNASWNSVAGLPVDVSVFATNVTKKRYYTFVPGLANSGFESAIVGEPRMFGVRLRYRFGEGR